MKKFDSSYDRGQAVNLAAQLAGRRKTFGMPTPSTPAKPVPATVSPRESPQMEAPLPRPPEVGFKDENVYRDQVWRLLLTWAIELTQSRIAFVCDSSGLVIAEVGGMPASGEAIPSSMVSALGNLRRCSVEGNTPDLISARFDKDWVTALTFAGDTPPADGLLIGLVGDNSPELDAMNRIGTLFREKISEI